MSENLFHPALFLEINGHVLHFTEHEILMRSRKHGLILLWHPFPAYVALVEGRFKDRIHLDIVEVF
jgi:hypothetical protein